MFIFLHNSVQKWLNRRRGHPERWGLKTRPQKPSPPDARQLVLIANEMDRLKSMSNQQVPYTEMYRVKELGEF